MEIGYPLRVWRYELRRGSGGPGKHPVGEGLIREIEVLADSVLTIHRDPPRWRVGRVTRPEGWLRNGRRGMGFKPAVEGIGLCAEHDGVP